MSELETIKFCSGFGQFHSNEIDQAKPNKKLTPYEIINSDQIRLMVDNPKDIAKSVMQWLIFSTFLSRNFKKQLEKGKFYGLWADLDKNPKKLDTVMGALISILGDNIQYELYTTKSATERNQKARILIFLATPLNGEEWQLCQEIINDKLEALGITPDRANEGCGQLCYLPNKGPFYDSKSNREGALLDPLEAWGDELEQKRLAIAESEKEIQEKHEQTEKRRKELKYTGNKPDHLITAFNEAYTVEDILLEAGYDQKGDKFRHPNSSSGRYTASVKDGRVHTLSSDDPLYSNDEGAHDAFSAFTVLFHGGE